MDNQQSTKMPKPFDHDDNDDFETPPINNTPQQFQSEKEELRQGKIFLSKFFN